MLLPVTVNRHEIMEPSGQNFSKKIPVGDTEWEITIQTDPPLSRNCEPLRLSP
jgi:hypothetical protein